MEILIGRNGDDNRLAVQIAYKTKKQLILLNQPNSVPNSVSRYKKDEQTAHCKVIINDMSQELSICNLNPMNYTWVDGNLIGMEPVVIDPRTDVCLGGEYYRLTLDPILKQIGYKEPVSIAHLEKVWADYERELLQMKIDQQKKANQSRLQGIISTFGMVLGIVPFCVPALGAIIPDWLRAVVICLGLVLAIFFYVRGAKMSNNVAIIQHELDKKFKHDYVCPVCRTFLGNKEYSMVVAQKKCPYCQTYFSKHGAKNYSANSYQNGY